MLLRVELINSLKYPPLLPNHCHKSSQSTPMKAQFLDSISIRPLMAIYALLEVKAV
jgi:hypothetical protein